MLILSDELRNESSQIHTRNAAGLALKNALSARVCERVVRRMSSPHPTCLGICKTGRVLRKVDGP